MQPTQPPMMPPQAYYPYPTAALGPQEPLLTKKAIFAIVSVGLLLIFIAQLGLRALDLGGAGGNAMQALYYVGAWIGTSGALAGALGSPKADSNQKLGLLILAGFLVMALTLRL